MGTQFRPKDGSGSKMYAPHRDAAYSYPVLLSAVLKHLDEAHWSPLLKTYAGTVGLTEAALGHAVGRLAVTFKLMLRHRPPVDWDQACVISGLADVPWQARLAMYSEFGVALLQYLPHALKEVTMTGEKSMAHDEYVDCLTAAVMAYRRMTKSELDRPPATEEQVENLRTQNMELERVILQQQQELSAVCTQLADLKSGSAQSEKG